MAHRQKPGNQAKANPSSPQEGQGNKQTPQMNQPMMRLRGQYIKNIEFKGPGLSARPQGETKTTLTFNVNTTQIDTNIHEIDLSLVAEIATEKEKIVTIHMNYGAEYQFSNVPADQQEGALVTEGARLIFPYVQRIVSDITRDGGLLPLQLPSVDFSQFHKKTQK
jgi:preprotein translocase subunit SecB